jgi:hypothetical protein
MKWQPHQLCKQTMPNKYSSLSVPKHRKWSLTKTIVIASISVHAGHHNSVPSLYMPVNPR